MADLQSSSKGSLSEKSQAEQGSSVEPVTKGHSTCRRRELSSSVLRSQAPYPFELDEMSCNSRLTVRASGSGYTDPSPTTLQLDKVAPGAIPTTHTSFPPLA